MTPEEVADLRNEIFKLHSLVSVIADAASVIEGSSMKVERVQALLDIAQRYSSSVLMKIEVVATPRLVTVSA